MAEDFLHLVPASLPSGSLVSLLLNGLVLLFLPNGWQFIFNLMPLKEASALSDLND